MPSTDIYIQIININGLLVLITGRQVFLNIKNKSILENFCITYFDHRIKKRQKQAEPSFFSGQFCLCFYNPFANVFNSAAISGFANSFIKSS